MAEVSKYDQYARVFYYSSKSGALLIGTPSFNSEFGNGHGDGTFRVVIDDDGAPYRHSDDGWVFIDSIDGNGDFHVYPYDYDTLSPLVTLTGRWGVFRASDGSGDMRLASGGGTVKEVTAEGDDLYDYQRSTPDDDARR